MAARPGYKFVARITVEVWGHDEAHARDKVEADDGYTTLLSIESITDARLVQAPNAPGANPKSGENKERG